MKGRKHGNFLKRKITKFRVLFKPSSTSATDLTNILNCCIWQVCWIEPVFRLKISIFMSGEHTQIKRKTRFFGILTSCLV